LKESSVLLAPKSSEAGVTETFGELIEDETCIAIGTLALPPFDQN
jgi:hypothetical protein